MRALLRSLHRAWTWITQVVSRAAQLAGHGLRVAGTRTVTFALTSRERLSERWHADSAYRRTVLAAVAAVAATLLPHPAAAAAIGALVAERPVRPSYRRDPYLDDDEDNYPPRRAPLDPWAPSPRRLWDNLE